jgi:N-acetylneuraminic acid mutarotase
MIVWGGLAANSGGRYNPVTDNWVSTSTINAPIARAGHTAVWSGSEMIVWGGFPPSGGSYFNTGGKYSPATDSWTPTSTTNAPSARYVHTAVWTGSEMTIWGGGGVSGNVDTGGRYDPATDGWAPTSTINAPSARSYHTAVWTGSEMIVWGGVGNGFPFPYFNTGGRYCAPGPPARLGNISTRAFVQTGDNVEIGGFIVQGTEPKEGNYSRHWPRARCTSI